MKKLLFYKKNNIGVIGDVMLDRYVYGKIKRISEEAPVPIVEIEGQKDIPGGAGNVAANIISLGGHVFLGCVIGKDDDGEKLLRLCKDIGISSEGVWQNSKRPTTLKTRIVAERQQVLRIDREVRNGIEEEKAVIKYVRDNIASWDAVVISDYAKGCITRNIARNIIALAGEYKKPVIVDTKPPHIDYMKGATLITPNEKEALEMTEKKNVREAGKELEKRTGGSVIVTQGGNGMTLFEKEQVCHIPAETKEVFDVSGAGDTVVAVLALGLAHGWSLKKSARIANSAAGIVVGKMGTAIVTMEELAKKLMKP